MPNFIRVIWKTDFQTFQQLSDEQKTELKKWLKWNSLKKVWEGVASKPYNQFLEEKLFFVDENWKYEHRHLQSKLVKIFGSIVDNNKNYNKLRKYQKETIVDAVKHLFSEDFDNFIISFSTGLGKTPTSLFVAEIGRRFLKTKVLVIVPASLQHQWYSEIKKWLKTDFVWIIEKKEQLLHTPHSYNIISYEKVRNWYSKQPQLFNNYKIVILDEASKLKNNTSKLFKVFKEFLKERKSILLTATPIENGLLDLHNLLVVSGGYYFQKKKELEKYFVKNYIYNQYLGREVEVIVGYQNLDDYKKYIEGKIKRLGRKDVLNELPKVDYQWINVKATKEMLQFLRKFLEENEEKVKKGDIFSLWTNLKTIVNGFYDAQNPTFIKNNKFEIVEELVDEILNEGENVVILTQYETIADYIFKMLLKKHGNKVFLVTGSTVNKQQVIDQWKQVGGVLIGTTTIARGFNLENANYMIVYNMPENPAELQQWIGRIVRLTSNDPKTIYLLVSELLEKRIVNLLNLKQSISNQVLGEGVYEYSVERLGKDVLWELVNELKEQTEDL